MDKDWQPLVKVNMNKLSILSLVLDSEYLNLKAFKNPIIWTNSKIAGEFHFDAMSAVENRRLQVGKKKSQAGNKRSWAGNNRSQAGNKRAQAGNERSQVRKKRTQVGNERSQA